MGRPSGFRTEVARQEYRRLYDEALALAPVPVVESDVATAFGATHVLSAGDPARPPLVALHAKSLSATMWLPLLPTLVATHRVHLVDVVGDLGKSVATGVLASPADVATWAGETMDRLGVDRAAVVGASLGCCLGAQFAMAHPERVERFAMVGPAGVVSRQHTRWVLGMLAKILPRPKRRGVLSLLDSMAMPASVPRLHADPWRPVAEQFVIGMLGFRSNLREPRPVPFATDRLAAAAIPVLAVVGRDETLHDGPAYVARLRERLPDARVEVVDDANHLVVVDQTDTVARLLGDFLGAAG